MAVLVRLTGEISTKAKQTRARFNARLADNIEDALRTEGVPYELERGWSRHVVTTSAPAEAADVIRRVHGVQSLSRVECRPARALNDVVQAGEELFRDRVKGKRFAVRARRVGDKKSIPFGSKAIENELGSALLPHARGVDLDDPEVTARVEVRDGRAYFFTDSIRGPGGLPLGTGGRAVALVSGGFDSAVASWLMLKRGVTLDYVFCNLGGATHLLGVLRVLKVLSEKWSYGSRPRLYVIDFQPLVKELQQKTHPRYWQVLLKRLMFRVAQRTAQDVRATGIVTGEAVGQVSSQTLQNLDVISRVVSKPLLRPLLGFDKDDIVAHARRIGTYQLSSAVDEYCAMVPDRPATRASLQAVQREEEKIDVGLVDRALDGRSVFKLHEVDPEAFVDPELEVEEIPWDAQVIDLRSSAAYRTWHYPGAVHMHLSHALDQLEELDRDQTYVVYCEVGLKSAHLAERMKRAGYRAYNFKGGMKNLMRYAMERDLVPAELVPGSMLEELV